MLREIGRWGIILVAVAVLAGCSVQLVAPYNSQLEQKASSMEAEVSSWGLTMRAGAGTVADDPRNPDVVKTLNKWRGEADAMLTLAVSSDPRSVSCNKAAQAVYAGLEKALPNNLRGAAETAASKASASSSCEVGLVADLGAGLDAITRALKFCKMSWVPDDYFAGLMQGGSTASGPPPAPSEDDRERLTKSCLAEFKAPSQTSGVRHNGRAVSRLLTTLQVIVYVENRKKAVTGK